MARGRDRSELAADLPIFIGFVVSVATVIPLIIMIEQGSWGWKGNLYATVLALGLALTIAIAYATANLELLRIGEAVMVFLMPAYLAAIIKAWRDE